MTEVRVPKVNANDPTYTLVEWLVEDGQQVCPGEAVAVLETSKATTELVSEHRGFVQRLVPVGTECGVGQTIARLTAAAPPEPGPGAQSAAGPDSADDDLVITAPARALIEEHRLDPSAVRALGRRVVRRADVTALIEAGNGAGAGAAADQAASDRRGQPEPEHDPTSGTTRRLSRLQRAVAAVVTESHDTVPAAFVAVKARVDEPLALARRLSREHHCLIGLPELLVKVVASLQPEFPLCFAQWRDPTAVQVPDAAHVGVTVDVGGGLQVPVLHHAAELSWHGIGIAMMRYRLTAMRGSFHTRDLAGGNIMVALHNDQDVSFAVPLVFPGHACAVSLGGTQTALALGPDRTVVTERSVHLGLSYDHRVISGRDAVAFLRAIQRVLGDADQLAALGSGAAHDGADQPGSA